MTGGSLGSDGGVLVVRRRLWEKLWPRGQRGAGGNLATGWMWAADGGAVMPPKMSTELTEPLVGGRTEVIDVCQ